MEGFICRRSRNQGTQPCLPAAHDVASLIAWYDPALTTASQDPREGPSLERRATSRLPKGAVSLGFLLSEVEIFMQDQASRG